VKVQASTQYHERISARGIFLLAIVGVVGCNSGPVRITQAKVDIPSVVETVFSQYDTDQGGSLSKSELADLASVRRSWGLYDTDGDAEISREEFQQRLEAVFDRRASLVTASCLVMRKGKPLEGAEVRLVPEEFLSDVLPSAVGKTREDGATVLGLAEEDLPAGAPRVRDLMRPGLYRVQIEHASQTIPEKYNSQTVLGQEVSGETTRNGPFVLVLE
jgi:hypothetical protein